MGPLSLHFPSGGTRIHRNVFLIVFLSVISASAQITPALVGSGYPQRASHLGYAPGQIVTLQVIGLQAISAPPYQVQRASQTPLPTELAGITVTVNQSVLASQFDTPVQLPPRKASMIAVGQSSICSGGSQSPDPPECLITTITIQVPFELTFNEIGYPQYPTEAIVSQ